ncbi:MAG: DNA polymerase (family X) [Candidatus Berkelbacteria bacterium Licking1014_7]|uniref:DNA-directed DNA polymerase n=1 Tax=Candidatus Berkelbacteria bacterium Licking1014_7 TaxID=2017147 RepID=A0A554LKF8_9BACT|nr:MAG: DNA polymerase (family X) [Candidatus Berkelbacteria bacterium Licking1014_7]
MNNKQISHNLLLIADFLELKNANSFEIRAYQNASRAVEFQTNELYEILSIEGKESLKKIPGIGEKISACIAQLITTGKSVKLEKLKKTIPAVEIEMMAVPGLGPKMTKKLFKLLRPKNLNDLDEKLKNEKNQAKLRKISVLEKTIKKVCQGIKILQSRSCRILLADALIVAEQIVAKLEKLPEIKNVAYAGSLRRRKETVGDIDIIASLKIKNQKSKIKNLNQNSKIIEKFIEIADAKQIIAQGENKASIFTEDKIQIDLEIMPQKEWGSLLHHFTGSKEHNIKLRAFSESQGLSFSEHGFRKIQISKFKSQNDNSKFKINSRIHIYCPTEEKVFQTLGLQFIPPELREGTDEIALAAAGKIPNLVKQSDILGDLQIHSTFSDGKNTILEMAQAAKKIGYKYILMSDHSAGLGITGGINPKNVSRYLRLIRETNQKIRNIRVLIGIEVNIRSDGSLDQTQNFLEKFDIVLGSLHSSLSQEKEKATHRVVSALKNPALHILAHPSGRLIDQRPEISADWNQIFETAKKYHKILEINASPLRLDLSDIYSRQAKKIGVKFAISTDAHSISQLDFMRYGIFQARRGWLASRDIINTLPLPKILKLFRIK